MAISPRGLQAVVTRGLSALRGCGSGVRIHHAGGAVSSHPTQLPGPVETRQVQRATAVRLHTVARLARHQTRRRRHAVATRRHDCPVRPRRRKGPPLSGNSTPRHKGSDSAPDDATTNACWRSRPGTPDPPGPEAPPPPQSSHSWTSRPTYALCSIMTCPPRCGSAFTGDLISSVTREPRGQGRSIHNV